MRTGPESSRSWHAASAFYRRKARSVLSRDRTQSDREATLRTQRGPHKRSQRCIGIAQGPPTLPNIIVPVGERQKIAVGLRCFQRTAGGQESSLAGTPLDHPEYPHARLLRFIRANHFAVISGEHKEPAAMKQTASEPSTPSVRLCASQPPSVVLSFTCNFAERLGSWRAGLPVTAKGNQKEPIYRAGS